MSQPHPRSRGRRPDRTSGQGSGVWAPPIKRPDAPWPCAPYGGNTELAHREVREVLPQPPRDSHRTAHTGHRTPTPAARPRATHTHSTPSVSVYFLCIVRRTYPTLWCFFFALEFIREQTNTTLYLRTRQGGHHQLVKAVCIIWRTALLPPPSLRLGLLLLRVLRLQTHLLCAGLHPPRECAGPRASRGA